MLLSHLILLENCHKRGLGFLFLLHSQNVRHQHILEGWSQMQCSAHISCSPCLHGPAKLAEKQCGWERWKEFWASYSIHRTGEFGGQTAVSLFAPSCQAQLHMAQTLLKHGTWPYNGNKRAPCFWRSAEGAILLVLGHQGSISLPSHERRPKAELPCPSEDGQPTKQAHQVLRGVLSPSPQSWLCVTYFCNTPTWAARKPRSWAIPGKGILFTNLHSIRSLVHCKSFTALTRKCHCSLQYKTKSGELVNVFL